LGAKKGCKRPDLSTRNRKYDDLKGDSRSSEYNSWALMKQRCLNKNRSDYKHYGGRDITIHSTWINDFPAFLDHIGKKPTIHHSLD
jgi:hypothetical protein